MGLQDRDYVRERRGSTGRPVQRERQIDQAGRPPGRAKEGDWLLVIVVLALLVASIYFLAL